MKFNVDGTMFTDQHYAGIGMVLYNDQWPFCFSACLGLHEVKNPKEYNYWWLLGDSNFVHQWVSQNF